MERQLQDNVTKRLQAILEPEDLLFDEPMKDYTTFRVGGPAKWMAAPQDEQQLRVILKNCRKLQIPCFILGRGSNLLVSDKGFDGVIVNLRKHFNKIEVDRESQQRQAHHFRLCHRRHYLQDLQVLNLLLAFREQWVAVCL